MDFNDSSIFFGLQCYDSSVFMDCNVMILKYLLDFKKVKYLLDLNDSYVFIWL